ncbi:MAG: alpha/beta fold hydrolase, partial [Xanthomonadaceae bacterium]|nr:alpha/beta fold hydrolase [Xanthomonadaceae bacterium]
RMDDQVKIRGFRIELGEIESELLRQPQVRGCVVLAREDVPGDKRLVGYVTLAEGAVEEESVAQLRTALRRSLPEYMVPSVLVVLEEIPLTPNGKVDKRSLPLPDLSRTGYVAPSTSTEEALVKIVADVLAVDAVKISVLSNFFELGGHSLLIPRLMVRIKEELGVSLTAIDLYSMGTMREYGEKIDFGDGQHGGALVPGAPGLFKLKDGPRSSGALLLIHPVGGQVHCYVELSKAIRFDGSIYAMQADPDNDAQDALQHMATTYLEVFRRVDQAGPRVVGGWSMGGVIAYEMARQMAQEGAAPRSVIMLDSHSPAILARKVEKDASRDSERAMLLAMASELGINFGRIEDDEWSELQSTSMDVLLEKFLAVGKAQRKLPADFSREDLRRRLDVLLVNERAFMSYVPMRYDGDVVLLRAMDGRVEDRSLGWAGLASRLAVVDVPGSHYSIVRRPHLDILVREFDKGIEGVPAPEAPALSSVEV